MGEDVAGTGYTREQRQRYREKVRQNLDVFEQMLARAASTFERPMTGLEIELNLVDADYAARDVQRRGAGRGSPTRTTRPSSARYNIELNVPPRPLPGDSALELEDDAAHQPQPRRGAGQRDAARTSSRSASCPPSCPSTSSTDVDERQRPLRRPQRGGLRRPRRGRLHRHRGADGRAAGHVRRHHRPRVRLHLGAAAPAGGPPGLRRRTGTPRRRSSARSWRWARTRRTSSAGGCGPRPGSSCSPRPPTPGRSS